MIQGHTHAYETFEYNEHEGLYCVICEGCGHLAAPGPLTRRQANGALRDLQTKDQKAANA